MHIVSSRFFPLNGTSEGGGMGVFTTDCVEEHLPF